MKIEAVVLVSLAIAFAIIGIVSLINMFKARSKTKGRKLPFRLGELPLSDDEKDPLVTTIRNQVKAWPVYWLNYPGSKEVTYGWLERLKGRRAILRMHNGKRLRRKAYMVFLMDGTQLDVPPMSEPKRIQKSLPTVMEVTSESAADPAMETMLAVERRHGAVPFEASA